MKTALFAGDPNWGRFCMAIGRAGVADLDQRQVSLFLDEVQVAAGGLIAPAYTEQAGAAVMAKDEFTVRVLLNRGQAAETVWTSDFSLRLRPHQRRIPNLTAGTRLQMTP